MRPELAIIIPTYNEEDIIHEIMKIVISATKKMKFSTEIIIVDDSNDKTPEILRSMKIKEMKVIHRNKMGVGSAIVKGINSCNAKYAAILMSDLPDDVTKIPLMYEKLENGFDVVHGSRFIGNAVIKDYPALKMIGNRLCNNFARLISGHFELKDFTNLFRGFKVDSVKKLELESNSFDIGLEMSLKALKRGMKIAEVPVNWSEREKGMSKFNLKTLTIHYFTRSLKTI